MWRHPRNLVVYVLGVSPLLRNHGLLGASRKRVDGLLGKPDEEGKRERPNFDYVYLLGTTENPFDIDPVWLGIKFEKDVVKDVSVVGDSTLTI